MVGKVNAAMHLLTLNRYWFNDVDKLLESFLKYQTRSWKSMKSDNRRQSLQDSVMLDSAAF